MGLYTTVEAEFSCRNCASTFVAGVQFKTGHEDGRLPTYREGEPVSDVPTGTYEGIVDAYCEPCATNWRDDERRTNFRVLAEAISSGRLVVRRGTVLRDRNGLPVPDDNDDFTIRYAGKGNVSPSEVGSIGPTPGEPGVWPSFAARLSDENLVLLEEGRRIYPTRQLSTTSWWAHHSARVHVLMQELGWSLGGEPFIEPNVVVANVISVERNPAI
jgi:hypothetical protein